MQSLERRNSFNAIGLSFAIHCGVLVAACTVAGPDTLRETNIRQGKASTLVLTMAAPTSIAVPLLDFETSPLDVLTEIEVQINEAERRNILTASAVPQTDLAEAETLQPTEIKLAPAPAVKLEPPTIPPPAVTPREKRALRTPPLIAGMTPSPPPVLAPTGADFDVPPNKLPENQPPDYPLTARTAGNEGRVVLAVIVNSQGTVSRLWIEKSSGHELLDEAAMEAVRKWRFQPAQRGKSAVDAEILVPVRFSMRQDQPASRGS